MSEDFDRIKREMQELSDLVSKELDLDKVTDSIFITHVGEIFYDSEPHRKAVVKYMLLYEQAVKEGMILLRKDALYKAMTGDITIEEAIRAMA